MLTIDGADSGGKGITAPVRKFHRPLMSVKKICKNGQRVIYLSPRILLRAAMMNMTAVCWVPGLLVIEFSLVNIFSLL